MKTHVCHCAYKVETSDGGAEGGKEIKIYVKMVISEKLAFFSLSSRFL